MDFSPFNKSLLVFLLVATVFSCKNRPEQTERQTLEIIKVDTLENIEFSDFFDSLEVIPLQTTKETQIGRIGRILINEGKMFILDAEKGSVWIFHENGEFINKIARITDFTLDKKNKKLIAIGYRPSKLNYYNLEGTFLSDEPLASSYRNIFSADGQLILINDQKGDYRLVAQNMKTGDQERYLPRSKKEELFRYLSIGRPSMVRSAGNYLTFPYSDTIFQLKDRALHPRYLVDFGEKTIPRALFESGLDVMEILAIARKKNYGFRIADFRESDSYVTFSYGDGNTVIYPKKSRVAKTFKIKGIFNFKEKLDGFFFRNYFAHDGEDNCILLIFRAELFKSMMLQYKKDKALKETWQEIPLYVKEIANKMKDSDNMVIVRYYFKE